jgi:hypothetical protein
MRAQAAVTLLLALCLRGAWGGALGNLGNTGISRVLARVLLCCRPGPCPCPSPNLLTPPLPSRLPTLSAAGACAARTLLQASGGSCSTVYQVIESNPDLSTLKAAVDAAGLKGEACKPGRHQCATPCCAYCLSTPGAAEARASQQRKLHPHHAPHHPHPPHTAACSHAGRPNLVATVFAPNNDGIARTLRDGGATQAQLLENPQLLRTLLSYHVVSGRAFKVGGRSEVGGGLGATCTGPATVQCWRLLLHQFACTCPKHHPTSLLLLQAADLKRGLKFRTLQGGEFAVDEVCACVWWMVPISVLLCAIAVPLLLLFPPSCPSPSLPFVVHRPPLSKTPSTLGVTTGTSTWTLMWMRTQSPGSATCRPARWVGGTGGGRASRGQHSEIVWAVSGGGEALGSRASWVSCCLASCRLPCLSHLYLSPLPACRWQPTSPAVCCARCGLLAHP